MRVLSLGAGIQSSTSYLTDEWDYAIFADTKDEPEAVYRHIDWLSRQGRAPIVVRSRGCLSERLFTQRSGKRQTVIPAYGLRGERKTRLRRQCTSDYKLEVVHQAIREILGLKMRQRFPKSGDQIICGIGFSYDEQGRIGRCIANWKYPKILPVFPLYEKRWTRQRCIEYLQTVVPHEVPRSACVFCPFRRNDSWRWLRDNDPSGWSRALDIDEALRDGRIKMGTMDSELYLHDDRVPLSQIDLSVDDRQSEINFEVCTGGCAS